MVLSTDSTVKHTRTLTHNLPFPVYELVMKTFAVSSSHTEVTWNQTMDKCYAVLWVMWYYDRLVLGLVQSLKTCMQITVHVNQHSTATNNIGQQYNGPEYRYQ